MWKTLAGCSHRKMGGRPNVAGIGSGGLRGTASAQRETFSFPQRKRVPATRCPPLTTDLGDYPTSVKNEVLHPCNCQYLLKIFTVLLSLASI